MSAWRRLYRGLTGFLLALVLLVAFPTWAQEVQPVPPLTARVLDLASKLTAEERVQLEQKLTDFETTRGAQVVVVIVHTTQPEDIVDYTQRLGDAWKIGRKDVGDGVLLVVALQDRRMRIATAKAVEGAIPDVVALRIIEDVMAPAFRQGDFAGGINAGLDHILARLSGEDLPLPGAQAQGDDGWLGETVLAVIGFIALSILFVPILVFLHVVMGLFGLLGRPLGTAAFVATAAGSAWYAFHPGVAAVAAIAAFGFAQHFYRRGGLRMRSRVKEAVRSVRNNPWQSAGGSWSSGDSGSSWSSGDSFSSGGGGDFGGGGASGSW